MSQAVSPAAPDLRERIVLCEGFYDRAFWAGLLEHLNCDGPELDPDGAPLPVLDPTGRRVQKGHFGFRSPGGRFIRVVPTHGKQKQLRSLDHYLTERTTSSLEILLLNVDSDRNADGSPGAAEIRLGTIEARVRQFDPEAQRTPDGTIILDGGQTHIGLFHWETDEPSSQELPNQHTLERIVCAALNEAFPGRGAAVYAWLSTRPDAPHPGPKEYAWSHMAGWYAERGCQDFYRQLWRDNRIAVQLERRLRSLPAWALVERLAS